MCYHRNIRNLGLRSLPSGLFTPLTQLVQLWVSVFICYTHCTRMSTWHETLCVTQYRASSLLIKLQHYHAHELYPYHFTLLAVLFQLNSNFTHTFSFSGNFAVSSFYPVGGGGGFFYALQKKFQLSPFLLLSVLLNYVTGDWWSKIQTLNPFIWNVGRRLCQNIPPTPPNKYLNKYKYGFRISEINLVSISNIKKKNK